MNEFTQKLKLIYDEIRQRERVEELEYKKYLSQKTELRFYQLFGTHPDSCDGFMCTKDKIEFQYLVSSELFMVWKTCELCGKRLHSDSIQNIDDLAEEYFGKIPIHNCGGSDDV